MPFSGLMGSMEGHGKGQLLPPARQRDLEVAYGCRKMVGCQAAAPLGTGNNIIWHTSQIAYAVG